jgi:hypothetical protein
MTCNLINKIYWPSTIALTPIVANHLNCFQNPLREDSKPIFRRQIEAFIFRNIEYEFIEPILTFHNFLLNVKPDLFIISKSFIDKQNFDYLISLSKPFIRNLELILNFLKLTNNLIQTYNCTEILNHIQLKDNILFSFNIFTQLFNNFRKSFALHHQKITKDYFFLYQFNIGKFVPSLGISKWGTLKESFFLRYVTNEIKFSPAALHFGDLIFDPFDTDPHKFVVYPYDKYEFCDFLFLSTQLNVSFATRGSFSKSKFLYELAQKLFDQMNMAPFVINMNNNHPCKFKNFLDNISYQKAIRSDTFQKLIKFFKSFTSAIRLNKKGKLKLDLPFEAIPAALIIYSNLIPSTHSSLFIKIFISEAPNDIIKLFEALHIIICFKDNKIRVSFPEFDNLIHYVHIKFPTLIFESRNHLFFFNTKRTNCNVLELLYEGIELSMRNFLITKERIANFLPQANCQVRFSRGDAWASEILFDGGEFHHNTSCRPYPRLEEHHHFRSQL